MALRFAVTLGLVAMLAGCAKPPAPQPGLSAYRDIDSMLTYSIESISGSVGAAVDQPMPAVLSRGTLGGRSLSVTEAGQIVLGPGEVVLTFDDGPHPGKTEAVLATLDDFDVKATFLMLGASAQRHPDLVRAVAEKGHTIGSHTFDHPDLTGLSELEAQGEILAGHRALGDALAGSGYAPSRFFRFPYLAQNGVLRTSVADGDLIVLGVDVDSKDYFRSTPQEVLARTLDRLDARGRGIILFHDIHNRTVAMLPGFLSELESRGYTVVSLDTRPSDAFSQELVTAAVD